MGQTIGHQRRGGAKSCRNRISDHIAFALIIYTLLLIFMVTPAIKTEGMAIWPYFLLVGLVALMVPFCRAIERRWKKIDAAPQDDSMLARDFTVDRCKLWLVAIGAPLLIALGFSLI